MINKMKLVMRWGFVFSALSLFSVYSLVMNYSPDTHALSQAVSSNSNVTNGDEFVAIEDDDPEGSQKTVCQLSQGQLSMLTQKLGATVVDINASNGAAVKVAVVQKAKGVNKKAIWDAISVKAGSCKIVNTHNYYMLNLLPGVS